MDRKISSFIAPLVTVGVLSTAQAPVCMAETSTSWMATSPKIIEFCGGITNRSNVLLTRYDQMSRTSDNALSPPQDYLMTQEQAQKSIENIVPLARTIQAWITHCTVWDDNGYVQWKFTTVWEKWVLYKTIIQLNLGSQAELETQLSDQNSKFWKWYLQNLYSYILDRYGALYVGLDPVPVAVKRIQNSYYNGKLSAMESVHTLHMLFVKNI
jgi:hypothetical protein